jgi:hypothetical protein
MGTATTTIYCPVCNRDVPISETQAPLHGGEAPLADAPQLVCLGYGSPCSGTKCPVTGLPSVVMGVQLARSGMTPEEGWRIIRMRCDGCDRITEMEVIDGSYASCSECMTTNRWSQA